MSSPFTRCANGHDLTVPDARIQTKPDGTRGCRVCVMATMSPSQRRKAERNFKPMDRAV